MLAVPFWVHVFIGRDVVKEFYIHLNAGPDTHATKDCRLPRVTGVT